MFGGKTLVRLAAVALYGALAMPLLCPPAWGQETWREAMDQGETELSADRPRAATKHFMRAVDLARDFPLGDERRAVTLVRLANAYRSLGDLAKPEELYEDAVKIARQAFGPDNTDYARYLNEAGRYFHARRKYPRAEELYREVFGIRVRHLGKEHPGVAESINNLAVLYENEALFPKAEVYYQHALEIREKALGPEHIDTIVTLEHYGRLLIKMNRSADAQPLLERAQLIRARHIAESAPPAQGEIFRRAPGVIPARLSEMTDPDYTEEARIARHEGIVVMEAVITAQGRVAELRLVRSIGLGLDEKAAEAVRRWTFIPACKDNQPVPFRVSLEVNFRML
ncbi:MAG TPA: TonB family protein [Bryobacterales bacterium]|nr:TonB family protein [Bryobacterales bacterium]